ncbi:MAG TPA: hypothetical protein VK464_17150 [Symbiobacteriaceae bacterium]|nr:hypothetical protein [Symbiobacteriaceae bacterium]
MVRRLINWLVIIVLVVAGLTVTPVRALPDPEGRPPEPDEAAVLQELFTLGRDRDQTEAEIKALDTRRVELEQQIEGARLERDRLDAVKRERQAQLGRRLRTWREQGQVAMLGALLSAQSLEQFLTRLEWIRFVLAHDSRLIRDVRELKAAVEQQEEALRRAEGQLDEARAKLAADSARLAEAIAQREVLLVSLRENRAAVEAKLNDLERIWNEQARPVLEALGATLLTVDPADFQPESVSLSFFPPGATVVVTDAGLRQFFSRQPALRGLTFAIRPGVVSMEGDFDGSAIRIVGRFTIAGKAVLRFEPLSVRIRDFDVPPQALEQLPGQGRVEIDVTAMIKPWSLQDVTMQQGELRIKAGLK